MKKKVVGKTIIIVVALTITIISWNLLTEDEHPHPEEGSLEHVHNMVSASNGELYLATHNGLFLIGQDLHTTLVGTSTDDFMSFVIDPTNDSVMYASGHSNDEAEGKEDYHNLNVLKSVDKGITWKEISKAVNGPVDFHAMGISRVNTNILYGWFNGLQRSLDGGYTWELIETENLYEVLVFETSPTKEDTVYAATVNGIMKSEDYGKTWNFISEELQKTPIISLSINPTNENIMFSNSKKLGLAKSTDTGKTWKKIDETFSEELITYITFDKENQETVLAITKENTLFKSTDQGETWKKIHLE